MGQFDPDSAPSEGPKARRIYEALKEQIEAGVYGSQGQLPSSRALALELRVSRTTVTLAYDQLLAEGFIEVRQGSRPRAVLSSTINAPSQKPRKRLSANRLSSYGNRLRDLLPWPDQPTEQFIADFRYGDLAHSDFPAASWKRAVSKALARQGPRLRYDDPRGSRRLRMALQGYLWRARSVRCDVDQILIVNGSQQGLDLCARLLLDPHQSFAIENPCYSMARQIFSSTGAVPASISVDRDGLDTNKLSNVYARMAYVTPSHQFPLGAVLSISRRHQLLDWAKRCDAYIIEDDYDSEYRYDINPIPPLYGLGSEANVIYLGTISKTLSPTHRIGYLVVPPALQDVFAAAKRLTDRHSPVTEQEALASLIESGSYESHVRRVRRLNGERRETLLHALRLNFGDTIEVEGAEAGLHVVVWLSQLSSQSTQALVSLARSSGVGLHPIIPLYDPRAGLPPDHRLGLVMGYAALDTRRIERGVQLLAQCVSTLSAAIAK